MSWGRSLQLDFLQLLCGRFHEVGEQSITKGCMSKTAKNCEPLFAGVDYLGRAVQINMQAHDAVRSFSTPFFLHILAFNQFYAKPGSRNTWICQRKIFYQEWTATLLLSRTLKSTRVITIKWFTWWQSARSQKHALSLDCRHGEQWIQNLRYLWWFLTSLPQISVVLQD